MNLNFACGGSRWPGFDNSDINGEPGTTYVDMDAPPYPYDDNSADVILMSHALFCRPANPPNMPAIFSEFYRILQPGGWFRIDDNPIRCWEEGEYVDEVERSNEEGRGYPPDKRITRDQLREIIAAAGFRRIEDGQQNETLIECDEETREAIIYNYAGHYSFTIEGQK